MLIITHCHLPSIADQIHNNILPEHLLVSECHIHRPRHRYKPISHVCPISRLAEQDRLFTFWVISIHVQDWTTDHLP